MQCHLAQCLFRYISYREDQQDEYQKFWLSYDFMGRLSEKRMCLALLFLSSSCSLLESSEGVMVTDTVLKQLESS